MYIHNSARQAVSTGMACTRRASAHRVQLALTAILALLVMSCSDQSEQAPTEADVESSALSVYSTSIDENKEARALELDPTHTLVEIRTVQGDLLFDAHYQLEDDEHTRVSYTLYPTVDITETVTSEIVLDVAQPLSLEQTVDGTVMLYTQVENAVLGNYDNWGCDLLPGQYNTIASCGSKGGCCDVHDACYRQYGCTASSWTSWPWTTCQVKCNAPVVACFAASHPGPSVCCSLGNCGNPR